LVRTLFNHRVIYSLISAVIILAGTLIAIRFASGYRVDRNGSIAGLGLLSANSFPEGGQIYLNDRLVSATDDTLYLEPGAYVVRIQKDGYSPWMKTIQIQPELVVQTNAELFRKVPSFTPLTFTGVEQVIPSPNGEKLLFYTASASAEAKNGLYVLEMSNSLFSNLSNVREPRLIASDDPRFDLQDATMLWSPDSSQVMITAGDKDVILDVNRQNVLAALPDVSLQKSQIIQNWEKELVVREQELLRRFPAGFAAIATQSASTLTFSPDRRRVMYVATASAQLPDTIIPPLQSINSQPQTRTLTPGQLYIYDREEDTNFQIENAILPKSATASALLNLHSQTATLGGQLRALATRSGQLRDATATAQLNQAFRQLYSPIYSTGVQWHPGSRHVIRTQESSVLVQEYDGTNATRVYAGPFAENFVYPWPDGTKLVILTSFSPDSPANLYAIELK
jgi:hypothetical protein